jgi:hypothetical protein
VQRGRTYVAVFALAAGGCGYPSFEFGAQESGVATGDAVADTTGDATVADSAVDDTGVDDTGTSPIDTGTSPVDTGTMTDAEPAPCSTTGAFCENWDDATSAQAHFKSIIVDSPAAIALASGGHSAPNAFASTTVPADAGGGAAYVIKPFDVTALDAPIRVDLWMKLETTTFPGTGSTTLFKIEHLGTGAVGDGLAFALGPGGLYADLYSMKYAHYPLGFTPAANTWFHVRIDIAHHTSKGSLTIWIDDMSTPLVVAGSISTASADSMQRNIVIGQYAVGATGTFKVLYDDVVVTRR